MNYETDHHGLVTRLWIEAGPNARRAEVDQHLRTARLMQRYQGLSGRIRIYLTRIRNLSARYTRVVGRAPQPGSRAFEAKFEIEKLPRIIHDRARELADPTLTAVERANRMAELDQLQADYQHYVDVLERVDAEIGAGYVAARDEPRSNRAARDADYPPSDEASGHYYVRSPGGGFHLRRFVGRSDPLNRSSMGPPAGRSEIGARGRRSTTRRRRFDPERRGSTPARAARPPRRRADRTAPSSSSRRSDRDAGESTHDRAMVLGVEVGLECWERAHSQGQGTGHESPLGILFAPEGVNRKYQNRGIEAHIRDLLSQTDDDGDGGTLGNQTTRQHHLQDRGLA